MRSWLSPCPGDTPKRGYRIYGGYLGRDGAEAFRCRSDYVESLSVPISEQGDTWLPRRMPQTTAWDESIRASSLCLCMRGFGKKARMIALGILVKSGKTEICFFRPWKRRLQETLDDFSPGMDLAIPRIAPVRSPHPCFACELGCGPGGIRVFPGSVVA